MAPSNVLRAAGKFQSLFRVLGLTATLLLASACSAPLVATETVSPPSAGTVQQTADEVDVALSEVSRQISAQLTAEEEDLVLAWSDFEADVRSVVRDLIRRPSRIDIEGMQERVDSLGQLLDGSALELPAEQWGDFVSAFQTLIDEATAADDTA